MKLNWYVVIVAAVVAVPGPLFVTITLKVTPPPDNKLSP